MEKLNLTFVKQSLRIEPIEVIERRILDALSELDRIHSFILYARYNENVLSGYEANYRICDNDKYNTIAIDVVAKEIVKYIQKPKGKYVLGYKQPPIEILIETFDPLIYKLALNESIHWKQLEFEDLYQTCRITLCNLYNKGYYIHKRLLAKSFNNEVLMEMRRRMNEPEIVSIYDSFKDGGNDDKDLTIADTIEDSYDRIKDEDDEELNIQLSIYGEVKDIIVSMIGQRRFEQLERDYKNKTTTSVTRREMLQIRRKFEQEGLTRKEFLRKYGK